MANHDKSNAEEGNERDDPLVCHCMKVRLSTLLALLEAAGPLELETLMEWTRAGTGCGALRRFLRVAQLERS